jgi:5S rRNA maturation endonuclease (ribonuclease M5)
MHYNQTVLALKEHAAGRELEILRSVAGIDGELLDGKHHHCPLCGGKDRFRLIDEKAGAVFCNQCFRENNGDFIDAVRWMCGCQFHEAITMIAEYLGVEQKDKKKPTLLRTLSFDYMDTAGDPLIRVERLEFDNGSKSFRQSRWDATQARYTPGSKGVPFVPWDAPSFREASTIYWCEGEKKTVDLARVMAKHRPDICCSCRWGGSNAPFQKELIPWFRGKDVVIFADNDKAGDDYAKKVAKALYGTAKSVQIVDFKHKRLKYDIGDYIAEGKNDDDVLKLIKTTAIIPIYEEKNEKNKTGIIKTMDLFGKLETDWLWENKLPAGELCLLTGMAGQGKTFWTCYLAAQISNGWDWPDGSPCKQGSVLFFRGEDSIEKTIKPRLMANGADGSKIAVLDCLTNDEPMTLHETEIIRQCIKDTEEASGSPCRMVIIDPISNYWGHTQENSNGEVRIVMSQLNKIASDTGAVLLLVQHVGKAERESMQQRVLGSTGIMASCRASFCLFYDKETKERTFAPLKNNLAIEPTSVIFKVNPEVSGGRVEILSWDVEKNADDIAGEFREKNNGKKQRGCIVDAEKWLEEFLADGKKQVGFENNPEPGTIRYESEKAGIAGWRTIQSAKTNISAVAKKIGKLWFWMLKDNQEYPDYQEWDANNERKDVW